MLGYDTNEVYEMIEALGEARAEVSDLHLKTKLGNVADLLDGLLVEGHIGNGVGEVTQ